jgi:hypothetical protein
MPSEHQINPTAAQQSKPIAGTEDLVALSSRARNRDRMVVGDEHSQPCRTRECLFDPGVVLAPDLALVDVGPLDESTATNTRSVSPTVRRNRTSRAPKIRSN